MLLNTGYYFFCNLIFPFKKRFPSIAFTVVLRCNGGKIEKKAKSPLCLLSKWPAIGIGPIMDVLTSRWCSFRVRAPQGPLFYTVPLLGLPFRLWKGQSLSQSYLGLFSSGGSHHGISCYSEFKMFTNVYLTKISWRLHKKLISRLFIFII